MSQPTYTALRQQVTSMHAGTNVSGNDIICAFIWKSIIRAWVAVRMREVDPTEIATLAIPFDARVDLSHLVPAQYLGNLNFEHVVTLPLRTLISAETTIPRAAMAICKNFTEEVHESSLLEAYSRLRSNAEYDPLQVHIRASHMSTEAPSVGILSPMMLPLNGTCFGEQLFANGGRPEAFRPMMGTCNRAYRTCFVILRKQHGGIEFVMTLFKEEQKFLEQDAEFSLHAFPVT
jgi:trichothecene 3-O-acetyltransferase